MARALEFIREATAHLQETVRIYEPFVGDNDTVCFEIEFDNLDRYEKWNSENVENPDAQAALQGWFEVTTGFHNELWKKVN